jgi:HEAT repeat protein
LGERKPHIKVLVRRQDIDGLVDAASYQELKPTSHGTVKDLGIPVRTEAILALGALDAASGAEALARGLRDPADLVRCAAIRVLQARQEAGMLVEALKWLPADDGHSRKLALQAVYDLRTLVSAPVAAEALIYREAEEALSEEEGPLILALLEADEAASTGELIDVLIGALRHDRAIVVDRAGELLLRLAPASIDALVAELRSSDAPAEAAHLLGGIADPDTLDALLEGLQHPDPRVRAASASATAELRDPAAVMPLLAATRDTDHDVRIQARVALDQLGNSAAIIAALLQPVIREAVRSAIAHPEAEIEGLSQRLYSAAQRQWWPPDSNGGPANAADRLPEAEHPTH